MTSVGHATVLIELKRRVFLTDPGLRNRVFHLRRHGPPPARELMPAIDAS